jgi:uncharacterized protein YbcI
MNLTNPLMIQRIAAVAGTFQHQTTGRPPSSVTVVQSHDSLVVTLHDALSLAERMLAQSPTGAAHVRELHRQLFHGSCGPLRREIEEITGVEVHDANTEVETSSGTVVQVFTTGARTSTLV